MINFDPKNQILFEDNHLIIINKYPSQIVQGDKTGDEPLSEQIKKYLKKKYNKPGNVFCGVVHRLDRPVSGIMILAKTSKAASRLSLQFAEHKIEKYYLAWVEGSCDKERVLENYLIRKEKKCLVSQDKINGKWASLQYHRVTIKENKSLLLIRLNSGRHHQIRCQMAESGHPVLGDTLYGSQTSWKSGKIALHAWKIIFTHPVKKEKNEFSLNPDFWPKPYNELVQKGSEQSFDKILNFFK